MHKQEPSRTLPEHMKSIRHTIGLKGYWTGEAIGRKTIEHSWGNNSTLATFAPVEVCGEELLYITIQFPLKNVQIRFLAEDTGRSSFLRRDHPHTKLTVIVERIGIETVPSDGLLAILNEALGIFKECKK